MFMVKIISLSEEAYSELKKLKGVNSFSEVVLGLVKPRKSSLLNLAGKWPGSKTELNNIKEDIKKERKRFKLKDVKF